MASHSGLRRKAIVLGLLLVAVFSFGWLYFGPHADHVTQASGESQPATGKAALGFNAATSDRATGDRLETVPVRVVQRKATLRLTGNLVADEKSAVASNVGGIVAEVRVDKGSRVRRGDVLVQIDPTDARNRLAEGESLIDELRARLGLDEQSEPFVPENQPEVRQSKAALDMAASNMKRAAELHERKMISTEVFEQNRTEHELATNRYRQAVLQVRQLHQSYKTALTRLAILRKALADTTIVAPFDGWVAERHVALGEQVPSGPQVSKIVTLVRIDPLRVALTVPQQFAGVVGMGDRVTFQVDSFPGKSFEAQIKYIPPIVASDTRSLVVEALASNADAALRPGLFVTAQLELPEQVREVYAPAASVQRQGETARVFVVRDGSLREQVVSLGETTGDDVHVKTGLAGNELVVLTPGHVRDGEPLRR